jgi:ABC-type sugar transport system substrate-binding protein
MRMVRGRDSRHHRRVAGAVLAAALGVVIAACSSTSSGTSSAGTTTAGSSASVGSGAGVTGGSTSAGVQAAEAELKVAEARSASINLPPVTAPIPSGKTVTFVHCGVAVCDTIAAAIKNAATVLGWKVDVIPTNGTPASVKAAWDTVVRLHPAVAFGSGFNRSLFASEAAQLASMKVPVMDWSTLDSPGQGITFVKGGPSEVPVVGEQMAAWVVASTQGKADTLYINLPTFVILQPVMEGFDSYYKQWCPGCKLSTMSVPLTSIGTTAPSLIVSYLRAHPDINRIAVGYDGVDVGLPAALASAGLSGKVKFVGEAPTATNLAYVQAGTEGATVAQGYYEIWSMYLDAAARALTGQSLAPDIAWKVPWFLLTQSNYSQGTGYAPIVTNLDGQLKQIWKK